MRDGTALAVDLYRPDAIDRHAAILVITPYMKDRLVDTSLGADGRPIARLPFPGLPPGLNPLLWSVAPLVEAGFVVAVADARGTGFSEGVYDYLNLIGGPLY